MSPSRTLAFTDGVIAIIITIMVLELKPPQSGQAGEFLKFIYTIFIYILSFIYVGIYWMNHHHLFQTVKKVNGKILLSNLGLLFFLSLIPLATSWISEDFAKYSVMFYGIILLATAIMYLILINSIIENDNDITKRIYLHHGNKKEMLSISGYIGGIILSTISPSISITLYFVIIFFWLIPDSRIEKMINTAK